MHACARLGAQSGGREIASKASGIPQRDLGVASHCIVEALGWNRPHDEDRRGDAAVAQFERFIYVVHAELHGHAFDGKRGVGDAVAVCITFDDECGVLWSDELA